VARGPVEMRRLTAEHAESSYQFILGGLGWLGG